MEKPGVPIINISVGTGGTYTSLKGRNFGLHVWRENMAPLDTETRCELPWRVWGGATTETVLVYR